MPRLIVARSAGFCFGVRIRAIKERVEAEGLECRD